MNDKNNKGNKADGTPRKRRMRTGAVCGYENKNGKTCQREAGWGTEHFGAGPCRSHDYGWANKRGESKAEYARPLLAKLTGYDIEVNPMDALLMCVRIAAAEVAYFSQKIGDLDEKDLVDNPIVTHSSVKEKNGVVTKNITKISGREELSLWIRARKESLNDLARFSKMALDAGVEERLVRVSEAIGETIAMAVRGILDDLVLSPEQKNNAPEIVRKHLRLLNS